MSIGGGEEDEIERMPNFSYSKQRETVEFKRMMIPLASMHFGVGVDFGGNIKVLSVKEDAFDFH